MAGVISALASIGKFYDAIKNSALGGKIGLSKNSAGYADLLKKAGLTDNDIKVISSGGDMVKILDKAILEPSIIVSKSMYARKDINNVIEASVDAYVAFYLAVFKTLTNVYNMEPIVALSLLANKGFDKEEYNPPKSGLIDLEDLECLPIDKEDIVINRDMKNTMDAKKPNDDFLAKTVIKVVDLNITRNGITTSEDTDTGDKTTKTSNLNFTLPLIIKANIHVVDIDGIIDSFRHLGVEASFTQRFIKWKVGAITTAQLLTASDLIDDYAKKALNPDNFSSYINKKSIADLNIMNVINKHRGLNKMVVTYIVSEKEIKNIGSEIGYDIDNRLEKQKLMNAMLAFNITTINTDRDIANTYISSISGFSSTPIKKMGSGSGKGNDGIEMLATALMTNKPF